MHGYRNCQLWRRAVNILIHTLTYIYYSSSHCDTIQSNTHRQPLVVYVMLKITVYFYFIALYTILLNLKPNKILFSCNNYRTEQNLTLYRQIKDSAKHKQNLGHLLHKCLFS